VSRSRWYAVAAVVAVTVAGAAIIGGIVLLREREQASGAPVSPTVAQATTLRSEPHESGAALTELDAGAGIEVLGRSQDSVWLFVAPVGRSELTGWLPVAASRGAGDIGRLSRIDSSPGRIATLPASGGPTRADLVLHSVGAKQDRLFVVVANDGTADFNGTIVVAVNGGAARRVDVGKPLRPGEALEAVLNTEYVQRRARVQVAVSTPDGVDAAAENNRLDVVVAPDQPIDLELEAASVDARDGHLTVSVRNRGPIPLVGTLTISVRESPPSNRLLFTTEATLDVASGAVQPIDLPPRAAIDLTRVLVSISTDAIADADPANDVYPQ
jgi:hypothetical protein